MSSESENSGLFVASHLRFKWVWVSLGLLFVCAITILSLVDLRPIGDALLQDKIMHVLAYGFLMGWFAQIYWHLKARVFLVIVLVAMGVGVEYLQSMVNYRQFDILDMVANTSGVLLAWLMSYTCLGRIFVGVEKLIPR